MYTKYLRVAVIALLAMLCFPAGSAKADPAYVAYDLNLRYGPGLHHPVIWTMPEGAIVEVGECYDGWCEVEWQDYAGFASEEYLDFSGYAPGYAAGYAPPPQVVEVPRYYPYYVPAPRYYDPAPRVIRKIIRKTVKVHAKPRKPKKAKKAKRRHPAAKNLNKKPRKKAAKKPKRKQAAKPAKKRAAVKRAPPRKKAKKASRKRTAAKRGPPRKKAKKVSKRKGKKKVAKRGGKGKGKARAKAKKAPKGKGKPFVEGKRKGKRG